MNNDVIRQPNDIMVCCLNPSIFVKKVKYLYSTALGKVEQTVKQYHTLWLCLQIKPKSSISHHPQTYEVCIYFKDTNYIFLNKVLAQLKKYQTRAKEMDQTEDKTAAGKTDNLSLSLRTHSGRRELAHASSLFYIQARTRSGDATCTHTFTDKINKGN